ncbi:MAG: COX15/CtaA family protein [Flavobacteriaceae bacterium]|nr:COX15/CtaA family protein [Flavobacteriaceae bacterium]
MNNFNFSVKASLILIFLVIVAGATVRVTGSGMGCPDWPKCFGYLIPPIEREQLEWKSEFSYNKNEIIIFNESLKIAKSNFKSGIEYNKLNWAPYLKHDYSVFNVFHTWIEFINRLLGAIAGIATLAMLFYSLSYWRKNKIIVLGSLLIVLGMGFQAWLGKEVVDSNLMPLKITIHMLMALIILALLVLILYITNQNSVNIKKNKTLIYITSFGFFLTLIQIFSGTQVRQFIDIQMNEYPNQFELWLKFAPIKFYFHRSFSIIILITHFLLWLEFKKNNFFPFSFKILIFIIGLEIFTGILMYYLNFPISTQPIHLFLATLIFSSQLYLIFQLTIQNQNQ